MAYIKSNLNQADWFFNPSPEEVIEVAAEQTTAPQTASEPSDVVDSTVVAAEIPVIQTALPANAVTIPSQVNDELAKWKMLSFGLMALIVVYLLKRR